MKTLSVPLALHYQQPLTTLARCIRVQWQNGTVLRFTDHDADLSIDDELYTAAPGFQDFAVQTHTGMAVDNSDIMGGIDDESIRTLDILNGLWDLAQVRFFEVNWDDLSMGQLKLRKGWVGEIKLRRQTYVAELRGLTQALVRGLGDLYAPDCQADLGDARCKVDLPALAVTGTVTSVEDQWRTFSDSSRSEAGGWYLDGVLTWLTGANAGKRMEVRSFEGAGQFQLFLRMTYPITIGDTYSATPGCNKTTDCLSKYNNKVNQRAFEFVPGIDNLLRYPDSHL